MTAYSLHHDKSPLGDYLRRMKSKLGPAGAGDRPQDRDHLLHDGEEASRIQRDTLGGARRPT
jgi:hypothetical protein